MLSVGDGIANVDVFSGFGLRSVSARQTLRRSLARAVPLLIASICIAKPALEGDEWQPISQEELKMTSEPRAPGAPAIILYRQVDRDDSTPHPKEYTYVRIKVFTEEGRKYANVAIPYEAKEEKISNIRARTVHSDGTIVEFNGQVFEQGGS